MQSIVTRHKILHNHLLQKKTRLHSKIRYKKLQTSHLLWSQTHSTIVPFKPYNKHLQPKPWTKFTWKILQRMWPLCNIKLHKCEINDRGLRLWQNQNQLHEVVEGWWWGLLSSKHCAMSMALHFVPMGAHLVYMVPNVDQMGAHGHKL